MTRYIRKAAENYPLVWTEALSLRADMVECDAEGNAVVQGDDVPDDDNLPPVVDWAPEIAPPVSGSDPKTLVGDALSSHLFGLNDKILVGQYAKDRWNISIDQRGNLEKMIAKCVEASQGESND